MQWKQSQILAFAAVGILGGATLVGIGMMRDDGTPAPRPAAGTFAVPPPSTTAAPPSPPASSAPAVPDRQEQIRKLDAALKKYAKTVPEFSVAVLDEKTGEKYSFRGAEKYETASVVKVQVLACLLLTAQDKDRDLTSGELSLAKRMIRASDNNATTALFSQLGRAPAVSRCNKRLGLTETRVSGSWGLTRTTVDDQVKLLSELVDEEGPLDSGSRKLAFTLMNTVQSDQDWGVPAVATKGEKFTVKNGWLSRSTEGGLWIINTVGRVTDRDSDVSVAVLSHRNSSMTSGIKVVEKAAKMTRQYLDY